MLKKTFGALAALSILAAGAAQAQTYGVDAMASTSGFTGTGFDNPPAVSGGLSLSAAHDPAYIQFYNGYGYVAADAASSTTAGAHLLTASVYAFADRIDATAFGNSYPQGNTDARWWDYVTIRSNSLPNGTPVEIVFRSAVNTIWSGVSPYSGSVYAEIRVGGYSASTTSRMDSTYGNTEVPGPEIRVKTTVGARLSLDSKLRLYGRAYYFAPGPNYDGEISIDTSAEIQMDPGTLDVYVEYDSD
ncbi:MAG TPA: hypothetical protein VGK43_06710 [Solirubrobacterales bacterium]